MSTRIEHDTFGPIAVPESSYYGAQTARSLVHFAIGRDTMPPAMIRAFALLKKAAALVNADLGKLDAERAGRIVQAADEILEGRIGLDQFPLRVWQTGSGTQTNMNVNEVIANRVAELAERPRGDFGFVDPNNHVNMSQSSNDTFPTAMSIAASLAVSDGVLPAVRGLRNSLAAKRGEFESIVKIGRTHLMDAVPMTLGQEFSGYVAQLDRAIDRIEQTLPALHELALGGTAVGTGLNTHPEFAGRGAAKIAELTGRPFRSHPNKFAALASHDEIVMAHGALQSLAGALMKIANDIRWLGSGPGCGLAELKLPANEPGSSIMPGKVNPTQCEAITMVAVQVHGNHAAIAFAGSQGNFELNVFKPVIIYNFLHSSDLIADSCRMFAEHCVDGLQPNRKRIDEYVGKSLMLATALNEVIGYKPAAALVKHAAEHEMTLRQAGIELGLISGEDFDRHVDPLRMTHP